MVADVHYWAVIPAAGLGKRMQITMPKQYLCIDGKTILAHTLKHFLDHPNIIGVVVVIAATDNIWKDLEISMHAKITTTHGGTDRCHSVLNGLIALESVQASANDWVLIHDAVRPCIRKTDIDKLINKLADNKVGGLLGLPVRDTLKHVDGSDMIEATIERNNLWHALTPQMFRFGILMQALQDSIAKNYLVSDEAQAIERMNLPVRIIEGCADNIKITSTNDLEHAKRYLSHG